MKATAGQRRNARALCPCVIPDCDGVGLGSLTPASGASHRVGMGGDRQPHASDPIVYIDRADIVAGQLDDLRAGIRRLVDAIESLEPQLIAYSFHLDVEAARMTVVAIHPDSESLELHLRVGGPEFRRLADMISLRQIDVYGAISERAREMLDQKALDLGGGGVTVHDRFAGFARPFAPRG